MSEPRPAICPNCGEPGEGVGVPCDERVCSKKGYHYIGSDDVAPVAEGEAPDLDPMVGRVVDEYLIVNTLGAGGFGKVYLVLQQPIMLKAALKLVHGHLIDGELGDRLVAKFRGEARALAQLTHPNIVRLLKFGIHQSSPYMVMEYVANARTLGKEIAQRAAVKRTMSPDEVGHILGQVVDGLGAAHRKGLVHRDIKPDNIMLQSIEGNAHFVRILDFGLAKDLTLSNETSVAMGTPAYMAPEQIRRRDLGPWTDWYALGVIAFELFTGKRAFGDATGDSLFQLKLDEAFDPTLGLEPDAFHPTVIGFLRKACAPHTDDRFRTAEEFRAGLNSAIRALAADPQSPLRPMEAALVNTHSDTLISPSQTELSRPSPAPDPLRAAREALNDFPHTRPHHGAPEPVPSEPAPFDEPQPKKRGVWWLVAVAVVAGLASYPWWSGPTKPAIDIDTPQATLGQSVRLADSFTRLEAAEALLSQAAVADAGGPQDVSAGFDASSAPRTADSEATVLIPAGSYPIGCQHDDVRCWEDEKPGHNVQLGAVEFMVYEVTHGAYERCLRDGACEQRDASAGCIPSENTPSLAPATCVSFQHASAFCAHAGMRLPTEQEWEAAARGNGHPQYPWGDGAPSCARGMFKDCGTFPSIIGSASRDKSWAGVRDMGGSVREWTTSRPLPYPGSKANTPRTSRKAGRVTRGGSWMIPAQHAPSALYRMAEAPASQLRDLGFRCVKDTK